MSVDIDVVFVPHQLPRETALAEISKELALIQARLQSRGIKAEIASSKTGDETKILARRDRIEVKVEINYVFRGTLLPVETLPLTKAASELFTTALSVPTLAVAELYGSKLVAALDRQHPRDLFDVHGMFERFGLRPEFVECFVGYIAGHNRPVHEVLGSRNLDLKIPFENEFAGMERESVSLGTLEEARLRLRGELAAALTDDHKRFLLGVVAGDPPWEAMRCRHLAELPAIQWKMQNLARLKRTNAAKFRDQTEALKRVFNAFGSG
ncbi:MAG: nucleotidyl transferase AbiEii/AbiGii toxin family protein [Opitutaceae bacterium]|nr:nucleotidyl transferase AbiEii/AbiGii toxin family protein [Opitutaceae bacterium]